LEFCINVIIFWYFFSHAALNHSFTSVYVRNQFWRISLICATATWYLRDWHWHWERYILFIIAHHSLWVDFSKSNLVVFCVLVTLSIFVLNIFHRFGYLVIRIWSLDSYSSGISVHPFSFVFWFQYDSLMKRKVWNALVLEDFTKFSRRTFLNCFLLPLFHILSWDFFFHHFGSCCAWYSYKRLMKTVLSSLPLTFSKFICNFARNEFVFIYLSFTPISLSLRVTIAHRASVWSGFSAVIFAFSQYSVKSIICFVLSFHIARCLSCGSILLFRRWLIFTLFLRFHYWSCR